MSASEVARTERPALRVIEGQRSRSPRVVAEILSDGTVRAVGTAGPEGADHGFATGHVSGDGWTIWWDRRYW